MWDWFKKTILKPLKEKVIEPIVEGVKEAAEEIAEVVEDVVESVGDIVEDIVDSAAELAKALWDLVKSIADFIVEVAKAAWTILVVVGQATVRIFWDIVDEFSDDNLPSELHSSLDNRSVASIAKPFSSSWSPASSIDYSGAEESRFGFNDTGKGIVFRLDNEGKVSYRKSDMPAFIPFAPPAPVRFAPNHEGPLAVSYHNKRRGEWGPPPAFDMIAASGDRVIAKKRGEDRFYLALPTEVYLHKTKEGKLVTLPQSFFKLDPERNKEGQQYDDVLYHLNVDGDDERHLATERWPTFRFLFWLLLSDRSFGIRAAANIIEPIIETLARTLVNSTGLRFLHSTKLRLVNVNNFLAQVPVTAPSYVWIEIDARPAIDTAEPPKSFPAYRHITYKGSKFSFGRVKHKRSVKFSRVLSLGVGLSHLHEQYTPIYGGEMDTLIYGQEEKPGGFYKNEWLYRLANGSIRDFGGWIDGTCIYYLLVQLKNDTAVNSGDLSDAYCILWKDEQLGFTERWRVLHPSDSSFLSPFKPIVGTITDTELGDFSKEHYWCPFRAGYITPGSRMSVARQVVVVNGIDPSTRRHEIYSVHFSWPSMDYSWRWRSMPEGIAVGTLSELDHQNNSIPKIKQEIIYPETLKIREDMLIAVKGTKKLGNVYANGYWVQKYLPADNQEMPSHTTLLNGPKNSKPAESYTHTWDFYSEKAFTLMDQGYSHFGVYQPVNSRIQCYLVELESDMTNADLENRVWVDASQQLSIARLEANWHWLESVPLEERLQHVKEEFEAMAEDRFFDSDGVQMSTKYKPIQIKRHPSLYEEDLFFKIYDRGDLGKVLVYYDKREDKNLALDQLGQSIVLTDRADSSVKVTLTLNAHKMNLRNHRKAAVITPPELRSAKVIVHRSRNAEGNSLKRIELVMVSARSPDQFDSQEDYEAWLHLNLYQFYVGIPSGKNEPQILLSERIFSSATISGNQITLIKDDVSGLDFGPEIVKFVKPNNREKLGLSIWFEGATGQVNTAERTLIESKIGA